jgi:hypothetical protein
MEKRLILEKVFNYNVGCGFKKTRFDLKPLHFKYALQDNIITEKEYDYFFEK